MYFCASGLAVVLSAAATSAGIVRRTAMPGNDKDALLFVVLLPELFIPFCKDDIVVATCVCGEVLKICVAALFQIAKPLLGFGYYFINHGRSLTLKVYHMS